MAAASYTTNLSLFEDFEATNTISTEVSGYTATAKGAATDSDFPIQGTQHASAEQRTAATGSLVSDYGSNITWTSGWNFFLWGMFLAPAAVNSDANAGIEMMIGSSTAAYHRWTVGGNDFGRYPYGGWQNFVVDPEVSTGRTTTGTPGTNYRWCGMLCDVVSAISKGSPYGIDVIRFGRGDLVVTNGDLANGYATFAGMASTNDNNTNRWGLFSLQAGTYLWKGLMSIGTSGTAVDFRDANRNIVVDNTRRVQSTFNAIEINNASSNVEWTAINIAALGTTSKGTFEMIDNATVLVDTCVFTDMDTFIFQSNADVVNTTFRRCDEVTQDGATFESCTFEDCTSTSSIIVDDPDLITDCIFESDGSNHAIEIISAGLYDLVGHTFIDYATADGSTGNEVIWFNPTGGTGDLTLNASGNTGTISVRNSSSGSVTIVEDPVTTQVTVKDASTQALVSGARVLVWATDNSNYFFEATVTITGTGTTATVTHTAHGLITGDKVSIKGASPDVYNGAYTVTVTNANTYTYTTNQTIGTSPATGTIKSTFVFINELTTGTGVVSDTRTLSNDQPIAGRIRKSTSSPYYVQGTLSGTVSASTGFSTTVQLISDE